jgi:hypothetical protein
MNEEDPVYLVRLDRLREYDIPMHDPWGVRFTKAMICQGTGLRAEPYNPSEPKAWKAKDHAARIRYLMQDPEALETPISLDCVCYGMHVAAIPDLLDGHHRLFAHEALGYNVVRASFGGRLDLLDYLTGLTDTKPEE